VPKIYVAGADYIVMDFIPGIKVTDIQGLVEQGVNRKELAYRLMTCLIIQVLRNGFFHADTHPGNISVTRDGSIVFYDLGAALDLNGAQRHLNEVMEAVLAKDAAGMVRALTNLKVIKPVGSRALLRKTFQSFFGSLEQQDLSQFHMSMASEQLFTRNNDRVFTFNANFVYLIRSITMLEGICKELDPLFDFADVFQKARPILEMQNSIMKPVEMLQTALATPQLLKSMSEAIAESDESLELALQKLKELSRSQTTNFLIGLIPFVVAMLLHNI
jgi:predicted unusual protein kinase regulating ubiquinone biosynthesis (AarF/ABC1/UbiB family)